MAGFTEFLLSTGVCSARSFPVVGCVAISQPFRNTMGMPKGLRRWGAKVITDIENLRFSYESSLFRVIEARHGPVPSINTGFGVTSNTGFGVTS